MVKAKPNYEEWDNFLKILDINSNVFKRYLKDCTDPYTANELAEITTKSLIDALKEQFPLKENSEEYLTTKETAELLQISLPTLNKYSKQGIIPSYRIQKNIRFKRSEIDKKVTEGLRYNLKKEGGKT